MIADVARARESIVFDDFGVDFAASDFSDIAALRTVFLEAVRSRNSAQWLAGDIYLWAVEDGNGGEEFAQVLDESLCSRKTVQNYASVCRAFPKAWRRVPLSMSHYEACAKLVKDHPSEALALLTRAYDGGMSREAVREEAAALMGETDTSIEVMLTWDAVNQVFIPNRHLELPVGSTRIIHLKQ